MRVIGAFSLGRPWSARKLTTSAGIRLGSVCLVWSARCWSAARKKNILSFLIGPPRVKPNWFWSKLESGSRPPLRSCGFDDRLSFLKKACAEPWRSLVPDLVTTLTKPPEERPNSAGAPSVMTTISLTASMLKVNAGRWPPRCSPKNGLLKSAPSTMTLLLMPFWPLIDSSSPSGPWTMVTPGVSLVKPRKLRPSLGSPSIERSSMRIWLSVRLVSISGAASVTVISSPTVDSCSSTRRLISLAERQLEPLADQGGEALELEGDGVGAERQQRGLEEAARVGVDDALVAGGGVDHADGDAGQAAAAFVDDGALDGAGDGLSVY